MNAKKEVSFLCSIFPLSLSCDNGEVKLTNEKYKFIIYDDETFYLMNDDLKGKGLRSFIDNLSNYFGYTLIEQCNIEKELHNGSIVYNDKLQVIKQPSEVSNYYFKQLILELSV